MISTIQQTNHAQFNQSTESLSCTQKLYNLIKTIKAAIVRIFQCICPCIFGKSSLSIDPQKVNKITTPAPLAVATNVTPVTEPTSINTAEAVQGTAQVAAATLTPSQQPDLTDNQVLSNNQEGGAASTTSTAPTTTASRMTIEILDDSDQPQNDASQNQVPTNEASAPSSASSIGRSLEPLDLNASPLPSQNNSRQGSPTAELYSRDGEKSANQSRRSSINESSDSSESEAEISSDTENQLNELANQMVKGQEEE